MKKQLLVLSALSLGGLASFPTPVLSADNVKVSLVGQKTRQVKATGIIRAPIQKVWKALTDYKDYSRFMPKVGSSVVHKRNGKTAIVTMKLDLPFPFSGTWYTNKYTENRSQYYYKWSMLKGSLKSNAGSWKLVKKGKFTHGTYRVQTDPGVPLIPQWVINTVTQNTVPAVFAAVEKRAQKL